MVIVGLAMGSFVNALTWRIYQQGKKSKTKTKIKGRQVDLSISTGRSVCINCGHELAPKDLIPVLSWLSLRGKCRYCHKRIEDSPLTELLTATLFVLSYLAWYNNLASIGEYTGFILWLMLVVGLVALGQYDLRHLILPNRILFPLYVIGLAMRLAIGISMDTGAVEIVREVVLGVLVGGGVFYLLFQISKGRWIGGGDVKLGFLIGIVLGPQLSLVALLSAFYLAAFFVFPLMLAKRVNRKSKIPFGPFLITGLVLAMLWGQSIIDGYNSLFGI